MPETLCGPRAERLRFLGQEIQTAGRMKANGKVPNLSRWKKMIFMIAATMSPLPACALGQAAQATFWLFCAPFWESWIFHFFFFFECFVLLLLEKAYHTATRLRAYFPRFVQLYAPQRSSLGFDCLVTAS